MAADATHNQSTGGNYKRQGGADWVVGGSQRFLSGSSASFESGSNLHILSGSTVNMAGTMNVSGTLNLTGTIAGTGPVDLSTAGAYIRNYLETASTLTALTAYGCSIVTNSSAAGANNYTIAAPITGVIKHIACLQADSTDQVTVDMAGASATFLGKTGQTLNKIVFATSGAANNQAAAITLFGVSTAQWVILSAFGTVGTTS